ncbi:MAG: protein-L-isoaspartate(D-aspartate) O-methyltransferase [bacterium]
MNHLGIRDKGDYRILRTRMVKEQIIARGIKDPRVIRAMEKVSRHLFVEEALAATAYGDFSLPIGEGQTISKPYIVALMTESLEIKPQDKVLEIGTGSGYQTAVLAMLSRQVFSVERIRYMALRARRLLSSLGCYNVVIRVSDGSQGWPEKIYFDAIIVTAAAPSVPEPLVEQLADKGRLIIPVGNKGEQKLLLLRREGQKISQKQLTDCEFVRLIGNYGWME